MDKIKAKEIVDYVFEDVFGVKNPFSLEQVRERFAPDIQLPKKVKGAFGGEDVWTTSEAEDRIVGQKAFMARLKKDEWMLPKRSINSVEQLLEYWEQVNYQRGERTVESTDVAESDGVYSSSAVYRSDKIFGSQNLVFSYNNANCKYLVASSDNSACTLGIRMIESLFCSSCFEVSWSNKVSKCMYVHDSADLYECIFCSHLKGKRYCIANMQFEKGEYQKIKEMVIKWTLENFDSKLRAKLGL